jgi:hypothetical protein
MPRSINKSCQNCSGLTVEQAQEIHGLAGDGCWDFDRPHLCHARRTYYRVRAEKNAKRQAKRSALAESVVEKSTRQSRGQQIDQITVPLRQLPVAFVYLYRQNREAPLHAIAVSVWRGDEKIAEVPPIHCAGLTNSLVNDYLRRILVLLKQKYGITQFKDEFYLPPGVCPLKPCPLKP